MNSFKDLEERFGKAAAEKVEPIIGKLEIAPIKPAPAP